MTTTLRDAAENATAGVPVVRGLVWDGRRAETVFGRYLVWPDPWSAGDLYEMRGPDCGDSDTLATADRLPTIDEAKAAAQTDYEQRILSALNPDYLTALEASQAEVERLTRERDFALELVADMHIEGVSSALTAAQERIAELEDGARHILPYLKWTISDESCGHHPTMPSAVAAFEATLSPAVKEPK